MSSNPSRRAFLATAAGSLAMAQQAQEAKPAQEAAQAPQDPSQTFSLDVTRVNVLFTVSDRKGRFVTNLVMEDFDIIEAKKKQKILEFATESDLPLRIAILVDTSNSIRARFRFEISRLTDSTGWLGRAVAAVLGQFWPMPLGLLNWIL